MRPLLLTAYALFSLALGGVASATLWVRARLGTAQVRRIVGAGRRASLPPKR